MNDRILIIVSVVVGGIALTGLSFRFFRPNPDYEPRESSIQNDSYNGSRYSGDDVVSYGRDDSSNSFRTSDGNSFLNDRFSVESLKGGKSKKSKKIGRSKTLRR